MLAIALSATLCANVFINGAAFLIPTLHTERGLDLAEAGLLSSMPSFGMVGDADRVGLCGGPGGRTDRVGARFGADPLRRRSRRRRWDSLGGRRRLPAARRDGRGEQQFGQWPIGGRVVSAGAGVGW